MPDETNGHELHAMVLELARGQNFAALTTLLPNGHPQTQVMWVDADDQHLLINTEVHRQKFRNVERDPRVTVMIWDNEDPYRFVEAKIGAGALIDGSIGRNEQMNGAESLVKTLASAGVDVCFANPGTSEMHFVAALDQVGDMRCVLGLFEGVATGAADGYARMADRPASTLLHLGPGLANGLANVHNARRANTPMVNIVGDHATYHKQYDAPLTSDVEGVARPFSDWVRTSADCSLGCARRGGCRGRGDGPAGSGRDLDPPRRRLLERGGRAGPAASRRGSRAGRTRGNLRCCSGLALRRARGLVYGRPCPARTGSDAGGSHRREDRRASPRADAQRAGGTRGGAGRCRLPPLPGRRRPCDPRRRAPPRAGRLRRRRSPSSLTPTSRAR